MTTKLKIDFVIQEICDDGSVAKDDLRFVKFGDTVDVHLVRDFLDRCANGVGLMFNVDRVMTLSFASTGPNKINLIKTVREVTFCGLKEAKDLVEAPLGTPIMIIIGNEKLKDVIYRLECAGASVSFRASRVDDRSPRMLPGPFEVK